MKHILIIVAVAVITGITYWGGIAVLGERWDSTSWGFGAVGASLALLAGQILIEGD